MNEEAQALLDLQEIDLALMRDRAQLEAMPQAEKLASIAAAKKKLSSELKRVIGMRKDIEMDIEDIQESHASIEQERATVKASIDESGLSYKEVQSLDAKLSTIAKQLEKLEFKLGALLEQLDEAKAAENRIKTVGNKILAEEDNLKTSFANDSAQIRSEIDELLERREEVLADISDTLRGEYDAAQKRFSGLAVEKLTGNVPSTCRVKLAQDIYQNLIKGPSIATCPYCHRILVVEGL